jgi:glycosyltransferase involved in cell wall biosynthesis
LKIFVTGTRGIPDIPGGIERHCQELYPRIAGAGHDVYLCTRSSYVTKELKEWKGVKLIHCFSPKLKSLEAILHTAITLIKAFKHSPDLVHIHAIGPSLLTPFAKILKLKTVVTNHGPDYERKKWGRFAKLVLRLGEKLGSKYANEIIAISSGIVDKIGKIYNRRAILIHNGVFLADKEQKTNFLKQIGISPKRYILSVARFVPEKGLHDLMKAFKNLEGDYFLVIAGDADHETIYSKNLKKSADRDKRIILTGYINGAPLKQLYSNAALFVLPSYHEGLPIALLEALSYGLPVLVSDIKAHKEITLPARRYFKCGDIHHLHSKMTELLKYGLPYSEQKNVHKMLKDKYEWNVIAEQTIKVYEKLIYDGSS